MGIKRPVGNESDGLGGSSATSVLRTEPIPDLCTSPIDVGHQLKPHGSDGATVNDDGERAWRVLRPNAADVGLGIGTMVRMGKEVAQLKPNPAIVRHGRDRRRIGGDESSDNAPRSYKLNVHIHFARSSRTHSLA